MPFLLLHTMTAFAFMLCRNLFPANFYLGGAGTQCGGTSNCANNRVQGCKPDPQNGGINGTSWCGSRCISGGRKWRADIKYGTVCPSSITTTRRILFNSFIVTSETLP